MAVQLIKVAVQLLALASHRPVDAGIRADNDDARQKESDEEQELFNGAAVFFEDGA